MNINRYVILVFLQILAVIFILLSTYTNLVDDVSLIISTISSAFCILIYFVSKWFIKKINMLNTNLNKINDNITKVHEYIIDPKKQNKK